MRRVFLFVIVLAGVSGAALVAHAWQVRGFGRGRVSSPSAEEVADRMAHVRMFDLSKGETGPGFLGGMLAEPVIVRVVGRHVFVEGAVRIMGQWMPGLQYTWQLRVYEQRPGVQPTEAPLRHERYYREWATILPPEQAAARLTFADNFDLAPGVYRIELGLCGFQPGFDFRSLKPGESVHMKAHGGAVGGMARVVVAD